MVVLSLPINAQKISAFPTGNPENDDYVISYRPSGVPVANLRFNIGQVLDMIDTNDVDGLNLFVTNRIPTGIGVLDSLVFDTNASAPADPKAGYIWWDDTDQTIMAQLRSGVKMSIGSELPIWVQNQTGTTISNGKAVYVISAGGETPRIALADNTSIQKSYKIIGLTTSDITHGGGGYVAVYGKVHDVNTGGMIEGNPVYLSTSGDWTQTKPDVYHIVRVGFVLYAHASEGIVLVSPEFGTKAFFSVLNHDGTVRTDIDSVGGVSTFAFTLNDSTITDWDDVRNFPSGSDYDIQLNYNGLFSTADAVSSGSQLFFDGLSFYNQNSSGDCYTTWYMPTSNPYFQTYLQESGGDNWQILLRSGEFNTYVDEAAYGYMFFEIENRSRNGHLEYYQEDAVNGNIVDLEINSESERNFKYTMYDSDQGVGSTDEFALDTNSFYILQDNDTTFKIQKSQTPSFEVIIDTYEAIYADADSTHIPFLVVKDSNDIMNSVSKWHRLADINTTQANQWVNFVVDTNIAEETTYGVLANADSSGFVFYTHGIFKVMGCAHASWTGAAGTSVAVYLRGVTNGVESRCLQSNFTRTSATGDQYIIPFSGTIRVEPGTTFSMQYYITNVDLDFEGPVVFDNPVAFSVNFEKISK